MTSSYVNIDSSLSPNIVTIWGSRVRTSHKFKGDTIYPITEHSDWWFRVLIRLPGLSQLWGLGPIEGRPCFLPQESSSGWRCTPQPSVEQSCHPSLACLSWDPQSTASHLCESNRWGWPSDSQVLRAFQGGGLTTLFGPTSLNGWPVSVQFYLPQRKSLNHIRAEWGAAHLGRDIGTQDPWREAVTK
jgi:hypothetical protein